MLNLENKTDVSDEPETAMSIEKYDEKLTHEVKNRAGLLNGFVVNDTDISPELNQILDETNAALI